MQVNHRAFHRLAAALSAIYALSSCASSIDSPSPPQSSTHTASATTPPTPSLGRAAKTAPTGQATPRTASPKRPASGTERAQRSARSADSSSYANRPEAMELADDIAARHELPPAWVRLQIGQARHLPNVSRLMEPASGGSGAKDWRIYRSRFVEPIRIRAGLRFWNANQASLERAEKTYGVPAEIIVGIVGIETIFGQHMGGFRVIDALATLALDFPTSHPKAAERSSYFQREIGHFLVLQQRAGSDPQLPRGSYAGAMGMPQFMPSSWASYAVDFDGDGQIDLLRSPADAIGSVANYLHAYGWISDMAATYPVQLDPQKLDLPNLLAPDIVPTFSPARFTSKGAVLSGAALQHPGTLALIELKNGSDAPSYVAGTENFYTITRYNWSSFYAMAVLDLGREVAAARRQGSTSTSTSSNASSSSNARLREALRQPKRHK